jgi:WD40 repeat protein
MMFSLIADFAAALDAMPPAHPRRRILALLDEAIRRDVHFIERHPTTLFQCLWNSCWWYDCDEAAGHYVPPVGGWSGKSLPWLRPKEERLCESMQEWRTEKEQAMPGFVWLRSLRPPAAHLGTALKGILYGHEAEVMSVAFSPDARRIASGSRDGTLRVWDASNGQQQLCRRGRFVELDGGTKEIHCVAFSPDGQRIATGYTGKVWVWDAVTGQYILYLNASSEIYSVAFSPDGRRMATGSGHDEVRLWDVHNTEQVGAFSPDGLLGDYCRGKSLLWLRGHLAEVFGVAFTPDGQRLATGGGYPDRTVRIWDVSSGRELLCLRGHQEDVAGLAYSPDGRQIVSGGGDAVRLWDAASGQELLCLRGQKWGVRSVAFAPNGKQIVAGCDDKTVRVWDASSGEQLHCFRGHERRVFSVSFAAEGGRIVSGSEDKTIRIWDASGGEQLLSLSGHDDEVVETVFSPDGKWLATGSWDKSVRLWDMASGRTMRCFQGHEVGVNCLSFAPDGQRLASGAGYPESTVRIWNVSTGQELLCLRPYRHQSRIGDHVADENGNLYCLVFSPDGRRLAIAGNAQNDMVWVCDASDGRELLQIDLDQESMRSLAFTPDGSRLVGGSAPAPHKKPMVRVWDALSGRELLSLAGHDYLVSGVASSPDGQCIVSGSPDNTVRVWDASSGACLGIFQGRHSVTTIAGGPSQFPLTAVSRSQETVVESVTSGNAIAWFPVVLVEEMTAKTIAAHPSGRIWAREERGYLYLFNCEGAVTEELAHCGGDLASILARQLEITAAAASRPESPNFQAGVESDRTGNLARTESRPPATESASDSGSAAGILQQVQKLLDTRQPEKALELLTKNRQEDDDRWNNAFGVCYLQMGKFEQGRSKFRGLVFSGPSTTFVSKAPTVYKANFAATLLAEGRLAECLQRLREINDEQARCVQKLRQAIAAWKARQSRLRRLFSFFGGQPDISTIRELQLGELQ